MSSTTRTLGILCLILFIILIYNWKIDEVYLWTIGGILAIIAQVLSYLGAYYPKYELSKDLSRAPIAVITLLVLAYIAVNIGMYILIVTVYIFWAMVIMGWIIEYELYMRIRKL